MIAMYFTLVEICASPTQSHSGRRLLLWRLYNEVRSSIERVTSSFFGQPTARQPHRIRRRRIPSPNGVPLKFLCSSPHESSRANRMGSCICGKRFLYGEWIPHQIVSRLRDVVWDEGNKLNPGHHTGQSSHTPPPMFEHRAKAAWCLKLIEKTMALGTRHTFSDPKIVVISLVANITRAVLMFVNENRKLNLFLMDSYLFKGNLYR